MVSGPIAYERRARALELRIVMIEEARSKARRPEGLTWIRASTRPWFSWRTGLRRWPQSRKIESSWSSSKVPRPLDAAAIHSVGASHLS